MTTTSMTPVLPAARPGAATAALAVTLLIASAIHLLVVREHLEEWAPAGVFFGLLAAVQAGAAVWVARRWDRRVASVVVVLSLATVATWVVSRTVGLPVGPTEMHGPEPVGLLDAACCVAELAAAAVALACWPTPGRVLNDR